MREFMAVTKALADENRVRILLVLNDRDLCVCQIVEMLQLAPSTVSKHLAILKQARLVESQKNGRWITYQLAGENGSVEAREAITWVTRTLANDPEISEDVRRIKQILNMDREELCRKQHRC